MEIVPEFGSPGEEPGICEEPGIRVGLKIAASDKKTYSTKEAEEKDLKYLIENSCMICGKPLEKSEVKVIPPQYMMERDRYVAGGFVARRYICAPCYTKITSTSRERIRNRYSNATRASKAIVKSFIATMLQRRT